MVRVPPHYGASMFLAADMGLMHDQDGRMVVFQIIRENGSSLIAQNFPPVPT